MRLSTQSRRPSFHLLFRPFHTISKPLLTSHVCLSLSWCPWVHLVVLKSDKTHKNTRKHEIFSRSLSPLPSLSLSLPQSADAYCQMYVTFFLLSSLLLYYLLLLIFLVYIWLVLAYYLLCLFLLLSWRNNVTFLMFLLHSNYLIITILTVFLSAFC